MSKNRPSAKAKTKRPSLLWLWIAFGVVAALAALFFLFQPRANTPAEISVAEAYQKYQQGVFFVDVRTQEEWDQGHAAKSILIPLDQLPNRLSEIPKDREVVIVCRSGNRSKQALDILRNAGYANTSSMKGGLNEWKTADYPLVSGQ